MFDCKCSQGITIFDSVSGITWCSQCLNWMKKSIQEKKEMKLKIWNEQENKKEFFLRLVENDNEIFLVVCDENGHTKDQAHLLAINKSTLEIFSHVEVDPELGFKLDDNGCIKIKVGG